MSKLRLVGAVGIKVKPDVSDFREETEKALKRLPDDVEIDVKLEVKDAEAKRKLKQFDDEHKDKHINVRVSTNYDSIQAARSRIQNALKDLTAENLKIKLDEPGLRKAMDKLNRLRSYGKIDMEITNDEAGYRAVLAKINRIRAEKASVDVHFNTSKRDLDRVAKEYEAKLKELDTNRTITITHRNDRDSLQAAVKTIDDALANLKQVEINPQLNEAALTKQRDALQKKLAKSPMTMMVTNDKEGYQKALAQIVELQRQAKSVEVKFKTDEKSLEKEAARLRGLIGEVATKANPTLTIKYDENTPSLEKALADVNRRLAEMGQIELVAELDKKGLEKARDELEGLLSTSTFTLDVDSSDLDALKRERQKLEEISKKWAIQDISMVIENTPESLEKARHELDELIKQREAPIDAQAITWQAAMDLAYASRARDVPFYVRINQRSLAIAEATLQSLAGINVLRESGKALEQIITKFDTFSLKVAAVSTLLAGFADAFVFMGTALFPVAEGMANLVGLLQFAPAAASAMTAAVLINISAFTDFKKAIDGNAAAMKRLPVEAQKTAQSLKGAWQKIQDPVQIRYWEGMGGAMRESLGVLIPLVSKGLANAAEHAGRFGAGVFNALKKASVAGGPVEKMLANLSGFFDNSVGAAEPLVNAINRLGLRGSEYLPRFGTWLTEITTRFDNWLKKSDEAGKLTLWMDQGIQSLKDMWTLSGGIIKMFTGIGRAAKLAGAGGLGDVAQEFDRIGEFMKGESFQKRLGEIFEGARQGASHLNVGVKQLGITFGNSTRYIANMLSMLGQLGGMTLSNLAKGFNGSVFQEGTLQGVGGMLRMVDTLEQGFIDLGSVIGNMSRIAGGAFEAIAPIINQVISLLNTVVGNLDDGLLSQIPTLTSLVGGFIASLSGPITLVSEILGGVLDWAADMGPAMQMAISALVGFLLVAGKIGPMFAVKPGGLMERIIYDFKAAETAGSKFGVAMKGIGAGLLGALGGPWGIAIGLITTGVAIMGAAQVKAAQDVDTLTDAIRRQDTEGLKTKIYKMWSEIDSGPMENFWRNGQNLWTEGRKAANEAADSIGFDARRITDAIAGGFGDQMAKDFDTLSKSGARFPPEAAEIEAARKRLGVAMSAQEIKDHALDFDVLGDKVRETNDHFGTAQFKAEQYGSQLDNLPLSAAKQRQEDFNGAMRTFNDTTQNADSRVRGLKDAIDILNGKTPNLEEATLKVNDAMRQAAGSMQTVDGVSRLVGGIWRDMNGNALNLTGVIDKATGAINTQSEAGANLYRNLASVRDNVLGVATGMRDAGKPAEEITKYLTDQREAWIASGVAAGQNEADVRKAWENMVGANPGVISTLIEAKADDAEAKVKTYDQLLSTLDGKAAITLIMGNNEDLGAKVTDSLGNLGKLDGLITTTYSHLDPAQLEAKRQETILKLIELADKNPTVKALMDPAIFNERLKVVNEEIRLLGLQKPTAEVKAKIEDALNEAQRLRNSIANSPATMGVNLTADFTSFKNKLQAIQMAKGGLIDGAGVQYFAKGGFMPPVKFYAGGGFENHTAQITRPNSPIRVWSEQETGGEAYIPMSIAKRERSTQILGEVARQFGYSLTRVQAFADGGVTTGGNSKASGLALHIGTYNQNSNETVEDVGRAWMRQVRSKQLTIEGF